MKLAAITGTNGKSSTISFTQQMLEADGKEVWTITNTGICEPGGLRYPLFWLREKGSIRKVLDTLSLGKEAIVLMEAYSISILADEWVGMELDAAAFTSFGRDHLDIHTTVDNYFRAKLKLFQESIKPGGTMVVHHEIPLVEKFHELSIERNLELLKYDRNSIAGGKQQVFLQDNYVCASHLFKILGGKKQADNFNDLMPLSGRVQEIKDKDGVKIYVDYGHNPDALQFTLKQLAKQVTGKIITVFGCGGDRDTGKRSVMGTIANELSDVVIVTDDQPRSEDPSLIRKEILKGCPDALEIYPRAAAIKQGLDMANKGDCLLITGMGSDQWFCKTSNKKVNDEEILNQLLNSNKS